MNFGKWVKPEELANIVLFLCSEEAKVIPTLEPLAMLWITYYFKTGTGNHAFKLLRKP